MSTPPIRVIKVLDNSRRLAEQARECLPYFQQSPDVFLLKAGRSFYVEVNVLLPDNDPMSEDVPCDVEVLTQDLETCYARAWLPAIGNLHNFDRRFADQYRHIGLHWVREPDAIERRVFESFLMKCMCQFADPPQVR